MNYVGSRNWCSAKIFTDVSRRKRVGAAAVWRGGGRSASLMRELLYSLQKLVQ